MNNGRRHRAPVRRLARPLLEDCEHREIGGRHEGYGKVRKGSFYRSPRPDRVYSSETGEVSARPPARPTKTRHDIGRLVYCGKWVRSLLTTHALERGRERGRDPSFLHSVSNEYVNDKTSFTK